MVQKNSSTMDDSVQEKAKRSVKARDMAFLNQYITYLRSHPKLTYLFLELTDSCNLACFHCGSSCLQAHNNYMDTDLLFRTLDTVAEDFEPASVMICLTGGEPMLHKDFYEIVKHITKLGFPWGITTNGTLIKEKDAVLLKKYGLQSVTISMDGLEASHDWLRGTPGCFCKTIEAIQAFHAVNIPVQVTTVIHKKNFDELDSLYQFMCDLGISSWRVINIEPIGRALQNSDLLLSREELLKLYDFIREKRFSKKTPMDVHYGCSHYLSFEYEHELRDNYFICGSGIYVGSILCNGDIYSCLDIERRPELVQGNVAKERFSKVWYEKFKEFRENRAEISEYCSKCEEKEFCGGDSMHTWDFDKKSPGFCILRRENVYE